MRTIPLAITLFACVSAFAQADLPARMKGKYDGGRGRIGDATLELVKQESPDKARVRINVTNTLNDHGFTCGFSPVETDAQRTDGVWKFSFPGRYCKSAWTMSIKPVEGKQRFEGVYTTDTPVQTDGTLYFEW